MEFHVANSQAALELCDEMVKEGKVQFFRGQSRDWPRLIPSLFRLSGSDREKAIAELEYFKFWSKNVPQMMLCNYNASSIKAIAQHYGIATNLLDLTTDPRVAVSFSKSDTTISDGISVIYCFNKEQLESLAQARIMQIDVHNLWRLEAQKGLFLEFLSDDIGELLRLNTIRIYFPSEKLSTLEKNKIYPNRKSALEIVIDQWFYRKNLEELTKFPDVPIRIGLQRRTYLGAFRWRKLPILKPDWFNCDQRWIVPKVEPVSITINPVVIKIYAPTNSCVKLILNNISRQIKKNIYKYFSNGVNISFSIVLPPEKSHHANSINILTNRCWDGIRQLPYLKDDMVYAIALTITLLLGRVLVGTLVDNWPETLLGEMEFIELSPVGGHIGSSAVSRKKLLSAFTDINYHFLTIYMRQKAKENPFFLMNYIVDPWILFDFDKFQRLFVRQIIPISIDFYWKQDLELYNGSLETLWDISFNPVLLGYVTNLAYRFESPLVIEKDCDHFIYIFSDMSQEDIKETFISCIPWLKGGGKPYQVRFHGYERDARPVWQIRRAIRHANWICSVGGISPLDVFPTLKEVNSKSDTVFEYIQPGLGAFELWLMAKGRLAKMIGKSINGSHPTFRRFLEDLMSANALIDELAKQESDWPGALKLDK